MIKSSSFIVKAMAVVAVALVFTLSGCGGKVEVKPGSAPLWVTKGSGAFKEESGKKFYGVSSAYGIKNPSLLRQTSENRARAEVAKTFETYTASLMKDYMASTIAGDPNASSEEQHVEQAVKTVVTMTLSGVEIVDHWTDKSTGELFSLAVLDLESFTNSLDKAKELDAKVRDYVRENAGNLHDELSAEEDKDR